jgi:hypothetical protein
VTSRAGTVGGVAAAAAVRVEAKDAALAGHHVGRGAGSAAAVGVAAAAGVQTDHALVGSASVAQHDRVASHTPAAGIVSAAVLAVVHRADHARAVHEGESLRALAAGIATGAAQAVGTHVAAHAHALVGRRHQSRGADLAGTEEGVGADDAVVDRAEEGAACPEEGVVAGALGADIVGGVAIDAVGHPAVGDAEVVAEGVVSGTNRALVGHAATGAVIDRAVCHTEVAGLVEVVLRHAAGAGHGSIDSTASRAVLHPAEVADPVDGTVVHLAHLAEVVS